MGRRLSRLRRKEAGRSVMVTLEAKLVARY